MKSIFSILIGVLLLLTSGSIYSQTDEQQISDIKISDFSGVLSFLSSEWMEGREVGTRGNTMAAEYIASMMELNGLLPYGDILSDSISISYQRKTQSRTYFQEFDLTRYNIESSNLSLLTETDNATITFSYNAHTDFDTECDLTGLEGKAPAVFAGFGISIPEFGYDDYRSIDVKGKVVIVLSGFPGKNDTSSIAWQKLGKIFKEKYSGIEQKRKIAKLKGAVAIIEINTNRNFKTRGIQLSMSNPETDTTKFNGTKYPEYTESFYALPEVYGNYQIPLFRMGLSTGAEFTERTGKDIDQAIAKARKLISPASDLPGQYIKFSIEIKQETIKGRNVLGIIYGEDTLKSVIVGAHYDDLGIRGKYVYHGADDNASGVAGMLAIAESWTGSKIKPKYNIIFASWTAEEKGMLGSTYFVHQSEADPSTMELIVNLDMISRSSEDDTAKVVLSVGTLTGSKLKNLALQNNLLLDRPLKLDLWESSADGGSDYAPFAARNIPVMTFFSGYHDDYHTPADTYNRVDLNKMKAVVELVNLCLYSFVQDETK